MSYGYHLRNDVTVLQLFGRFPTESDRIQVLDPTLGSEYLLDVVFVAAANVHYLTGQVFAAWMREAGVSAGDQIKLEKRQDGVVLLSRVPPTNGASSIPPQPTIQSQISAPFSVNGQKEREQASHMEPPFGGEGMSGLDTLAAAAGYAGQHGTPAIEAVLAHAASVRGLMAAAGDTTLLGKAPGELLLERLQSSGVPLPPEQFVLKKRRTESGGAISAAGPSSAPHLRMEPARRTISSQLQAAFQGLMRSTSGVPAAGMQATSCVLGVPPVPPPTTLHPRTIVSSETPALNQGTTAFAAIMAVLSRHVPWTPAEAALVLAFRAKYGTCCFAMFGNVASMHEYVDK
jgi:hypothetical protein